MNYISRHIKAALIGRDIFEDSSPIPHSKCLTLQHYSFECERPRNENGMPYGRTLPSTLTLTVKGVNSEDCKSFYSSLHDGMIHSLSIVFNAAYNTSRYLRTWEAAVIATGYIVEIDEQFDSWNGRDPENEQQTVTMKMLLSKITLPGDPDDKTIDIIH